MSVRLHVLTVACTFAALSATSLFAQDPPRPAPPQDLGATFGLTKENNAVPAWSQADAKSRSQLSETARQLGAGIVIVGSEVGGHGTAWVISKKHRLLVTNAHVADIMHESGGKMSAVVNETKHAYEVKRVWYHPGLRRAISGSTAVSKLSTDPKAGRVDPYSPDLAVLELADGGPDLPVEFRMVDPDAFRDLVGQPAAIFGFPGHDTLGMPAPGKSSVATLHSGIVSRMTDFHNGAERERQQLQYTMSTWNGFSGSPVFLPDGRVIAVHNMASPAESQQGVRIAVPHGVRIDCVWELLVHHKLQDKVSVKIDASKLNMKRWLEPDERDERRVKVQKLLQEARELLFLEERFADAETKLNEAIRIAPDFAALYRYRGTARINFASKRWASLSSEDQLSILNDVYKDKVTAGKLDPTNPMSMLGIVHAKLSLLGLAAISRERTNEIEDCLAAATLIAKQTGLSTVSQAAAQARRGTAFRLLGKDKESIEAYSEAIRLNPKSPEHYLSRAQQHGDMNRLEEKAADLAKAEEVRKQNAEAAAKKKGAEKK